MIANLLFTAVALCAISTAQAQDQSRLVVKGNVSSDINDRNSAYAVLIASDGERMQMEISPKGHYMVNVPAKDSYLLRFYKPGFVTKEIAVDGHYANTKNYGERTVKFDITLEAQDQENPVEYSGPAVEVSFAQMSRDLRIEEQNELIPMVAFNDQASNVE
ncbi:MAG: hypothetical protein WAR83_14435 [Flavobacteriales bacterium]